MSKSIANPLPKSLRNCLVAILLLGYGPLGATVALAHHPMGGKLPATLMQGLLSGLGHPIIGIDHLAFILGIGLLAAVTGLGVLLPVMFVVAMGGGLALHLAAVDLPGVELAVASSAALIGLALVRPRMTPSRNRYLVEAVAFAMAGLFHGYALADSIIGAEATPLVAYIVGLVTVQSGVALAAFVAARGIGTFPGRPLVAVPVRAAGLAIFLVGAVLLVRATGLVA